MYEEKASYDSLHQYLDSLGKALDTFLKFEHEDAVSKAAQWKRQLGLELPQQGAGIDKVVDEIAHCLLPNASAIPKPGFTSFITTGATSSAVLANFAGNIASPQRYSLHAFNFLEELSLDWMRELFSLHDEMKGIYSSGGSSANIIALGAARQHAFEAIGIDPAKDGLTRPCRIYASEAAHHTVHRAAAVLGLGRASVCSIPVDPQGRISVDALRTQIEHDLSLDNPRLNVAIVANAGTTDTGAIDPLDEIAELAQQYKIWLHIDGAYGLPGILDPEKTLLYKGLDKANSVSVDPHKWLGAPVGIGTTFVKDRAILCRAFTQEAANYLEGSFSDEQAQHSMDSFGIPYDDFGLELSAPCRGVVVWAILREIGAEGLRDRICRHNAMAQHIAKRVNDHPELELALAPTLSVCCFRYAKTGMKNLDDINRRIHRQLVRNNENIPSTTYINGKLVLRPCFVGARTDWQHADALVDEVLEIASTII